MREARAGFMGRRLDGRRSCLLDGFRGVCICICVALHQRGHGALERWPVRRIRVKDVRHDPLVDDDVPALRVLSRNLDHFRKYPASAAQVAYTLRALEQRAKCVRIGAERAAPSRIAVRVEHFLR